ncbi:MAG: hypothetical protein HXY25_11040 [Alphaproteobacteria bacterium]|nr:hypothetical protein [Alphaproteobacteria bacterium]
MVSRAFRAGPCLPLVLGLAACGGASSAELARCPRAGVLSDASSVTAFADPAGAGDVRFRGEITNVVLACDPGKREVDSELTLTFRGELGPAAQARTETTAYFVAVVDSAGTVLAKDIFPVQMTFPEGQRVIAFEDRIDRVRIPVAAGMSGAAYEIIVGFDLTPAEVDYNRARRGAR